MFARQHQSAILAIGRARDPQGQACTADCQCLPEHAEVEQKDIEESAPVGRLLICAV